MNTRIRTRGYAIPNATAQALTVYLRIVGPTLNPAFRFQNSVAAVTDGATLTAALEGFSDRRPPLYAMWIADHLNLLAIAFADNHFLRASRLFRYLVDDSFGGRVVSKVLDYLSVPQIRIAEGDPASRLRSLREVMNMRSGLVIAVDGRGPYFDVGTGVVTLARTLATTIVPCSAVATTSLRIPNRRVRITVPAPFSVVSVRIGDPIEPPLAMSLGKLTANHVREALNRLRSHDQSSRIGVE